MASKPRFSRAYSQRRINPLHHYNRYARHPHQTDHRHVNNQEYLRWMQEVAIEHSSLQGWPMARYLENGASWYVKSHFIEYLRPAWLGNILLTCTWVSKMGESSSLRRTLFLRADDRQIVTRAETQWIFVSLETERPIAIPAPLRKAFPIIPVDDEA